jgi:hypothetical protein
VGCGEQPPEVTTEQNKGGLGEKIDRLAEESRTADQQLRDRIESLVSAI